MRLRWSMNGGHLKDFQEFLQELVMSEKSKQPRRSFSAEFKQNAVDPVVHQRHSFKAAADAVGVAAKQSQGLARKVGYRV